MFHVRWVVGFLLFLLAICRHAFLFYRLMKGNVTGAYFQQELMARHLVDYLVDPDTACPQLSVSLANAQPVPLKLMSKEELDHQIEMMVPTDHTGRNLVLQCPQEEQDDAGPNIILQPNCRGVVKVFRSESTYHHVKRCLILLQDSGITARLLYSDDETLTLVEEEIASSTLWEAPIPREFDIQLLFIRCILLQHSIVHRDFTAPNFVVNPMTGRLYIIDFGDAFVWDDQWMSSGRNLVNLFNIWWRWHDEDSQRQMLVDATKPRVKGGMKWKRPVVQPLPGQWEPSEEDLKFLGGRRRFDLLQDIHT